MDEEGEWLVLLDHGGLDKVELKNAAFGQERVFFFYIQDADFHLNYIKTIGLVLLNV